MTYEQQDSAMLQTGQQVITVCAAIHKKINDKEYVFLPKRADSKKFLPGVFELPGGHVDYGEELVTALTREISEELHAEITVGEPFAAFTYMNDVKQTHSVEIVYFAQFKDSDQVITLDPSDHSEFVWVSSDEVHKVYTENKGADDDEMIVLRRAFEILDQKN
jgi:8-oxo-dGTP diphosphatase